MSSQTTASTIVVSSNSKVDKITEVQRFVFKQWFSNKNIQFIESLTMVPDDKKSIIGSIDDKLHNPKFVRLLKYVVGMELANDMCIIDTNIINFDENCLYEENFIEDMTRVVADVVSMTQVLYFLYTLNTIGDDYDFHYALPAIYMKNLLEVLNAIMELNDKPLSKEGLKIFQKWRIIYDCVVYTSQCSSYTFPLLDMNKLAVKSNLIQDNNGNLHDMRLPTDIFTKNYESSRLEYTDYFVNEFYKEAGVNLAKKCGVRSYMFQAQLYIK